MMNRKALEKSVTYQIIYGPNLNRYMPLVPLPNKQILTVSAWIAEYRDKTGEVPAAYVVRQPDDSWGKWHNTLEEAKDELLDIVQAALPAEGRRYAVRFLVGNRILRIEENWRLSRFETEKQGCFPISFICAEGVDGCEFTDDEIAAMTAGDRRFIVTEIAVYTTDGEPQPVGALKTKSKFKEIQAQWRKMRQAWDTGERLEGETEAGEFACNKIVAIEHGIIGQIDALIEKYEAKSK